MSTGAIYLNDLDRLTTEMMEYVCDHLCRYPEMEQDEGSLEELCSGCKMGRFICSILNQGNARTNEREEDHEQE